MTTNVLNDKECKNQKKGVYFPFSNFCSKLLDELIQESRKEIYKEKNTTNEQQTL
jgi:hypothetical protein